MGTRLRDNHNIDKTIGTRVDSALPTERTLARVCREATQSCLDLPKSWSLASGITAGSTIRLPVPNTNFGRRWCLPSRVLQTRPTCDRTPDHVPARCCMGPPLQQSSACSPSCSARWFLSGCVCRFPSQRPGVNVEGLWIIADNSVQRANVLAVCVQEHSHSRARVPRGWRHCEAERQVAGHEHVTSQRRMNGQSKYWIPDWS